MSEIAELPCRGIAVGCRDVAEYLEIGRRKYIEIGLLLRGEARVLLRMIYAQVLIEQRVVIAGRIGRQRVLNLAECVRRDRSVLHAVVIVAENRTAVSEQVL